MVHLLPIKGGVDALVFWKRLEPQLKSMAKTRREKRHRRGKWIVGSVEQGRWLHDILKHITTAWALSLVVSDILLQFDFQRSLSFTTIKPSHL